MYLPLGGYKDRRALIGRFVSVRASPHAYQSFATFGCLSLLHADLDATQESFNAKLLLAKRLDT